MIIIDNILVSEDLIYQHFCCNLSECGGICCIEGDAGAPLEEDEIADLEDYFDIFKKYMTEKGIRKIEHDGSFDYDADGNFVTPLINEQECAYIYFENGIAKCAIEKAFLNHEIPFRKPISCYLYPIRISNLPDYEVLNYHQWPICKSACCHGAELKIPVYQFLKEPLIIKYGKDWFKRLEKEAQKQLNHKKI